MKDFLGNTVEVGDHIFYSTTSRWSESRLCEVTRFTDKSMFAKIIKVSRSSSNTGDEVIVKNDFVKVNISD
jgi:hypothetical protein